MRTLWDLIEPIRSWLVEPAPHPRRRRTQRSPHAPRRLSRSAQLYEAIAREMLTTHDIRVRKWRRSTTGIAVEVEYRDGRKGRYIESPRPRTPLSLAVFLHEIGHHVLGIGHVQPRCLEEYRAWKFALDEMERRGVPVPDKVRRRMDRSLRYAVAKARRRGLRTIPPELRPYATSSRERGYGSEQSGRAE